MLRGYWFLVFAVGLTLTCATHAKAESNGIQSQTHQSAEASHKSIATSDDHETKPAEIIDQQVAPCGPENYGSNADLCAQWKSADAAADSAWWAWAGGLIGLGSLVGVFAAIWLAFRSNRIASDTATQQLRAYMGISNYDLTPFELGVVGAGRFMIAMQNFGQTPAFALTTHVSYAITNWVDRNNQPDAWDYESGRFPIDVAPGAHMFREIDFSKHAGAHLFELQAGASAIWVRFHASYEDVFGRQHEQTTLFYSRHSSYLSGTMLPCDQSRETTTGRA